MFEGIEELIGTFREESEEIFDSLDMNLLSLEKDPHEKDLINSIFRSVHTLKGAAGMIGLENTNRLAHTWEDMLDQIRGGRMECTGELITLWLNVLDCLKDTVRAEMAGGRTPDECQMYIDTIRGIMSDGKAAGDDSERTIILDDQLKRQVEKLRTEGFEVYLLEVFFDEMCPMKSSGAFLVVNNIGTLGEIVRIAPALESSAIEEVNSFNMVFASRSELVDEILEACEVPGLTERGAIKPFAIFEEQAMKTAQPQEEKKPEKKADVTILKERHYIRIPGNRIEYVMGLVDELFIGKSRFLNMVSDIRTADGSHPLLKELVGISRSLDKLTSKIQKMVIDLRRIPLNKELVKFNRLVRDLSVSTGKKVKMDIESNDVEIDRELWKKMVEPVNSILEKIVTCNFESESGIIRISADYLDSDVVINFHDNDEKSGIESCEWVEQIREQMKSINGRFTCADGRDGIRCQLRVPTNSSKIDVFFFKIAGTMFSIPADSVDNIIKFHRKDIKTVKGKKVVMHRGRVIPILEVILEGDPTRSRLVEDDTEKVLTIIINEGDQYLAFPVDEVLGEEEILLKKLEDTIIDSIYTVGATVLGDGDVILVLSPSTLMSEDSFTVACN